MVSNQGNTFFLGKKVLKRLSFIFPADNPLKWVKVEDVSGIVEEWGKAFSTVSESILDATLDFIAINCPKCPTSPAQILEVYKQTAKAEKLKKENSDKEKPAQQENFMKKEDLDKSHFYQDFLNAKKKLLKKIIIV